MTLTGLGGPFNWTGLLFLANAELMLPIAITAVVVMLFTARLNLAIVLACLPTAVRLTSLIAFTGAAIIHGF